MSNKVINWIKNRSLKQWLIIYWIFLPIYTVGDVLLFQNPTTQPIVYSQTPTGLPEFWNIFLSFLTINFHNSIFLTIGAWVGGVFIRKEMNKNKKEEENGNS